MIPEKVRTYLAKSGIPFQAIEHARAGSLKKAAQNAGIPENQIVRAVLLEGDGKLLLVCLPLDHLLDFASLCQQLGFEPSPLSGEAADKHFSGCEAGTRPPLPRLFGFHGVIDERLKMQDQLYLQAGSHDCLIQLASSDFLRLNEGAQGLAISDPLTRLMASDTSARGTVRGMMEEFAPQHVKERLQEITDIPPMPESAQRILELASDPNSSIDELGAAISIDPALSAQLIRWARSALYGYRGEINSVREAIINVLGFDLVMSLAVGLAINDTLEMPEDGPLGRHQYWRQAVNTAVAVENLVRQMPPDLRPKMGLAYLGGLLHNFGYMVVAHAFPAEFFLLNRFIQVNGHVSADDCSRHALGFNQEDLGAWLLHHWDMPEAVVQAVRHQHDAADSEDNAVYAQLIKIGKQAVRLAYDDSVRAEPVADDALAILGLSQEKLDVVIGRLRTNQEKLDELTEHLTA